MRGKGKPFEKGRKKTGGRVKGSPSSLKREYVERLAELGGDPMATAISLMNDSRTSKELRGRLSMELMKYLYPQRKAIEHSGPGGGPIETHDSAVESLANRVDGIAAAFREKGVSQPTN